jgi:3-hydroxy acid dehydrogenase/malonic semialdehyde reductase
VHAFNGSLLRELVGWNIRVTCIAPGMVEVCLLPFSALQTASDDLFLAPQTNFSITRFRGDEDAAKKVYEGITPLSANDIAEEIVWAASRPGEHRALPRATSETC